MLGRTLTACSITMMLTELAGCLSGREISLVAPSPQNSLGFATQVPSPQDPSLIWRERFDNPSLSWIAPFGDSAQQVASVYSIASEQGASFLHAHHDARPQVAQRVKAIHFGKAFELEPPALEQVTKLRWRWRVRQHPSVQDDPWLDLAASVHVIVRQPSLLRKGTGFKFGWTAATGRIESDQRGIFAIELRSEPAGPQWRQEEVDLCGLYRKRFGPCEAEHVQYVGVLSDADGTGSVSEADYADFELVRGP